MSQVRKSVAVAAGANADVNLSPFDRFSGRGGQVVVKATCVAVDAGKVKVTVMVGSDIVANSAEVGIERAAGVGPDNETQAIIGIGAPADPITINIQSATGASGAGTIVQADIQNA